MESPEEVSPVPDDEATYKDRYLSSIVQVKGDIAGLQFELISLASKQDKNEKVMRVILLASLLSLALVLLKVTHE